VIINWFNKFFKKVPQEYRIVDKKISRFSDVCDHNVIHVKCDNCCKQVSRVFHILDSHSSLRKYFIEGIYKGQSDFLYDPMDRYIMECLDHVHDLMREMKYFDNEEIAWKINELYHDLTVQFSHTPDEAMEICEKLQKIHEDLKNSDKL